MDDNPTQYIKAGRIKNIHYSILQLFNDESIKIKGCYYDRNLNLSIARNRKIIDNKLKHIPWEIPSHYASINTNSPKR